MNEPKKPADPEPKPGREKGVPGDRPGAENGVPDAAKDGDAKGAPDSGRLDSETAANP